MENEYLLEYKGKTFTKRLEEEIGSHYFELQRKAFPNDNFPLKALSIVTIRKDEEILKIGSSCVNDLIAISFIRWFATWFSNDGSFKGYTSNDDIFNNVFVTGASNVQTVFNTKASTQSIGSQINIGDSATPPTRNDTKLNGQKQAFNTGNGGYSSGLGRVSMSGIVNISTTFDLSETSLNGIWLVTSGDLSAHSFVLSHDLIDPVIPVAFGDQANVNYVWQLS